MFNSNSEIFDTHLLKDYTTKLILHINFKKTENNLYVDCVLPGCRDTSQAKL